MATSTQIVACFTCGKETGRVKCEGCSKNFCLNHFQDHFQELSKQLDEVEVTRDLFRQSLTEKIDERRKHAIIEQVDQWENESINKIRQAAEETRQILLKHTNDLHTKMEDKLNKLTDQLRQSRQNNAFFERDLNQWTEELAKMKDELTKPSNITIRQDRTPLVNKINVNIDDERSNIKPNRRTHVTVKETNDQEKFVYCSFCDEKFSSSEVAEHLMLCGNKTVPCPNCRKLIRRAIFGYHYENNCADLDETDNDVGAVANRPDTSSSSQRNNSSQSSATGTYIICRFCDCDCDPPNIETHQKNCLKNPDNTAKRQQPRTNPTSNQNSDRLNDRHDSNNTDCIPCEYCHEPIVWCDFKDHTKACSEQHNKRIQEQTQRANNNNKTYVQCQYCDKGYLVVYLASHEKICERNPVNIESEKQYRTLLGQPLPKTGFL